MPMKLVRVLDQGEPWRHLLAKDEEDADILYTQLRACWGTDSDSLFEIIVEDFDDREKVMDELEKGN